MNSTTSESKDFDAFFKATSSEMNGLKTSSMRRCNVAVSGIGLGVYSIWYEN
jgi:hypothetical protein